MHADPLREGGVNSLASFLSLSLSLSLTHTHTHAHTHTLALSPSTASHLQSCVSIISFLNTHSAHWHCTTGLLARDRL